MSFESRGCCPPIKLCDIVEGTPIPFLRKFVEQCEIGEPVTIVAQDFELDGVTPYTVVNQAEFCPQTVLNQFEGLVLHRMCDDDTGEVVGYFAVVRTEEPTPGYETIYFDTAILPIAGPPAGSSACEMPQYDFEIHQLCYFTGEPLNQYENFLRKYRIEPNGVITTVDTRLDGVTPYTVVNEVNVVVCPSITSEIVCYQSVSLVSDPARGGDFTGLDTEGNLITTVGDFGGVTVSLETNQLQGPVTGAAVELRSQAPYPARQRVVLRFSKPVVPTAINVAGLSNVPGNVQRLTDFNVFPSTQTGGLDISNGMTVESTGLDLAGSLAWDKAVESISFVIETQASPEPDFDPITLAAFTFDEVAGVEIRKAKCVIDSNSIIRFVDALTALSLPSDIVLVDCDFGAVQKVLSVGYMVQCDEFPASLYVNTNATFATNGTDPNTITFESVEAPQLIRNEIAKAQELEAEQRRVGLPVTPLVITSESFDEYIVEPSAYIPSAGIEIAFEDSGVISWGPDQTDLLVNVEYSILGNCDCVGLEMLQEVSEDNTVRLIDIVNPGAYDPETGTKPSLLNDGTGQLPFGNLGPFAGPCPPDEPVLSLEILCCNDDLTTKPAVANQRLAWLDGADVSLMYNSGLQIGGNDGDTVDEIRDKLEPGIAESVVVPNSVGVDTGAAGPTLRTNALNGLSILEFDGVDDRLRLDTNNPAGGSFAFFGLVAKGVGPVGVDTVLAVGTGTDGQDLNPAVTNWQINSDFGIGNENLVVSFRTPLGENIDPDLIEGTWPDVPTDGIGAGGTHRNLSGNIADAADFFDGQFHLLTVTYSNTSMLLSVYIDGDRRLIADFTPTPQLAATLQSDYFRFFGNRNGGDFSQGRLAEMIYFDADLDSDEIATVNAYLICKWSIDPSLAVGGAGDLTLNPLPEYTSPTRFVRVVRSDGNETYRDTGTGQEYPVPPLPGLSICGNIEDSCIDCFDWYVSRCDRRDRVNALDLFQFDDDTEEVFRINGLTGAVLDSHTPAGPISWTHGTIYDPTTENLYLFDTLANEWHRYDATNLAAGNTNLGALAGDPITGPMTFGAFDVAGGFAYVGRGNFNRFRIDFTTLTALALPAMDVNVSSLSIDNDGNHYATTYVSPSVSIDFRAVNPLTGVTTLLNTELGIQINGSDYDTATDSGWYGVDAGLDRLFRWTQPDGSDIQDIGAAFNPGGSLAVGSAAVISRYVEFQKVFHKRNGVITSQSHDYDGNDFIVEGFETDCPKLVIQDQPELTTYTMRQLETNLESGDPNYTLPEGTVTYTIYVQSGSAEVNTHPRQAGWSITQPAVAHGDTLRLYPSVGVSNILGDVYISYTILA